MRHYNDNKDIFDAYKNVQPTDNEVVEEGALDWFENPAGAIRQGAAKLQSKLPGIMGKKGQQKVNRGDFSNMMMKGLDDVVATIGTGGVGGAGMTISGQDFQNFLGKIYEF